VAGPPDEPPTRRIDPTAPPPVAREHEVVTEERDPERLALLDELGSLKRALALVGAIAIAALGVGLWALLAGDDGNDARGASRERVSDLEERVNELEGDVENAASDESVSELRQEQEQLGEQVGQLSDQAGGGDDEARQAAEELGQSVEQLEQRVDAVEQQQEEQAASGGGSDTP
jgi:gas vesicle protein